MTMNCNGKDDNVKEKMNMLGKYDDVKKTIM